MELLKFFFLTCLWIFNRALLIYLAFLHIQFIVVWIKKHKTSEGAKYPAFMKSQLLRENVWIGLTSISVGLAVVFCIIGLILAFITGFLMDSFSP